ncbi:hypothetical protein LPJ75_006082, partial [Coemansia sp. RSA 2598]
DGSSNSAGAAGDGEQSVFRRVHRQGARKADTLGRVFARWAGERVGAARAARVPAKGQAQRRGARRLCRRARGAAGEAVEPRRAAVPAGEAGRPCGERRRGAGAAGQGVRGGGEGAFPMHGQEGRLPGPQGGKDAGGTERRRAEALCVWTAFRRARAVHEERAYVGGRRGCADHAVGFGPEAGAAGAVRRVSGVSGAARRCAAAHAERRQGAEGRGRCSADTVRSGVLPVDAHVRSAHCADHQPHVRRDPGDGRYCAGSGQGEGDPDHRCDVDQHGQGARGQRAQHARCAGAGVPADAEHGTQSQGRGPQGRHWRAGRDAGVAFGGNDHVGRVSDGAGIGQAALEPGAPVGAVLEAAHPAHGRERPPGCPSAGRDPGGADVGRDGAGRGVPRPVAVRQAQPRRQEAACAHRRKDPGNGADDQRVGRGALRGADVRAADHAQRMEKL